MTRWFIRSGVFGSIILTASVASAQPPARAQGGPPAPQRDGGRGPQTVAEMNRQILPTNLDFEQILPIMQSWRDGLGVTCAYCHVYVAPYDPKNDFASDAKEPKKKARVMLRT